MITAPREKTEYTTMMGMEIAGELSSQIFDFRTFVTEIFRFKVPHISFFFKYIKTQFLTNFAAKLLALPKDLD